jgi:hypothetical protein
MLDFWNKWAPVVFAVSFMLFLVWLIAGCVPFTSGKVAVESEKSLIDSELEKVKKGNEAYRKLEAQGCSRENLKLIKPLIIANQSYYEYECELDSRCGCEAV